MPSDVGKLRWCGDKIRDMHHLPVNNRSSRRRPTAKPLSNFSERSPFVWAVLRRPYQIIAVYSVNNRVVRPRNSRGVFGDSVQHRLNIRRRAGDDAQNLPRRSLLLERLLEFLEQPHVFECDDCLVGKGFQKFDLRRCEGAYLNTTRAQCSNNFAFLVKGDKQKGTRPTDTAGLKIVSFIYVGNVKRSMLPHPTKVGRIKTNLDAPKRNGAKMSPRNQIVSLAKS